MLELSQTALYVLQISQRPVGLVHFDAYDDIPPSFKQGRRECHLPLLGPMKYSSRQDCSDCGVLDIFPMFKKAYPVVKLAAVVIMRTPYLKERCDMFSYLLTVYSFLSSLC